MKAFNYKSAHPLDNLLTDINTDIRTRSSLRNFQAFFSFVSDIEPKHYADVLGDRNWTLAMQYEVNQFERNQV